MKVDRVPAAQILELQRRQVDVLPKETYQEIGVRSFGKGLFIKPVVSGNDLGTKRVFYIEPGDLVVSNIFAWEGAVGVATQDHAGMIGSHRFMTWRAHSGANVRYLAHYFSSEDGLAQLRAASPGSAGRNRTLSIKNFEAIEVPLPSLPDQRRIAAHLDAVQGIVKAALERERTADIAAAWLSAAFAQHQNLVPLETIATVLRGTTLKLADTGPGAIGQAAVRWGSIDLARTKPVDNDWSHTVTPERLSRPGDLLLNSTGEGTIGRAAVVDDASANKITDSKVLTIRPRGMRADVLAIFLRSPQGQDAINRAKGANTTKQTELGIARAKALQVPLISDEAQTQLASSWASVQPALSAANALSAKQADLLRALLPAARNEVFSQLQ